MIHIVMIVIIGCLVAKDVFFNKNTPTNNKKDINVEEYTDLKINTPTNNIILQNIHFGKH